MMEACTEAFILEDWLGKQVTVETFSTGIVTYTRVLLADIDAIGLLIEQEGKDIFLPWETVDTVTLHKDT